MRRRIERQAADLFAEVDGHAGSAAGRACAARPPYRDDASVGDVSLIRSPLVDETKEWLSARALTLGNMLASERAVEYVAILRALAAFRAEHEPEPLHEDVERKVCGEDAEVSASATFKADIHQLKEWNLITERIEKERLRGYRDNRRAKFRYRMCDDAAAFVEWLEDRHAHDLLPGGGDETGNLLDMQRSILAELRRMLHRVDAAHVGYETAGDVLFRVDQVSRYVDATAKTLQELNLRLLSFGIAEFSAEEAKPIVDELAVFLERFGRRFGTLREDILRDVEEMRRDCHAKRWKACADTLAAETSRFRHIASVSFRSCRASAIRPGKSGGSSTRSFANWNAATTASRMSARDLRNLRGLTKRMCLIVGCSGFSSRRRCAATRRCVRAARSSSGRSSRDHRTSKPVKLSRGSRRARSGSVRTSRPSRRNVRNA